MSIIQKSICKKMIKALHKYFWFCGLGCIFGETGLQTSMAKYKGPVDTATQS